MDHPGRRSPSLESVRVAYGALAPAYIELFGMAAKASEHDRGLIGDWAASVAGPVLDAGCGPGHWAAFLRSRHLDVQGVDATPEFVNHATYTYPEIDFDLADLRDLPVLDESLAGVLAWFSLIHTDPEDAPVILREFARVLRPGGRLLLGFFGGTALAPFDHKVVTAWAWPIAAMVQTVEAAGFQTLTTGEGPAPNGRIAAHITARRPC